MDAYLALFAAALALMGSPGPATMSSAGAGAAFGRAALPYVCGIATGTSTVTAMVAAGLTGLIFALPGVAPVVTALASAYILYLAWKIATAPPLGTLQAAERAPPFLGGYLLAVANPKAYAAMGALFSGFVLIEGDPVGDNLLKVGLLCPFAFLINITWMQVGTAIARRLQNPRASRILNVVFAVALVVSVAMALLI
ncbi:MAG: LysE family transporter [Pseudomonadota bacterium]